MSWKQKFGRTQTLLFRNAVDISCNSCITKPFDALCQFGKILTPTLTNKFTFDRDQRGQPLEILVASHLHNLGLPIGYNPASGTDDPSREDYDLYVGQPDNNPLLLETKMDWQSGSYLTHLTLKPL